MSNDTAVKLTIPHYPPNPEGITKVSELPPATPAEQIERMAFFRKIVAEFQYQPVHWYNRAGKRQQVCVDLTTASMVCQLYDRLNEKNRAAYCSLEPLSMIEFGWELLG